MNIKEENGVTVITPEKNKRLRCGDLILSHNQSAYLGVKDNPDNWTEIDRIEQIIFDSNTLIYPNTNGSRFEQNRNVITFDTDTYSGGTVFEGYTNKDFNCIEITYKTETPVPFKVQVNRWEQNEVLLEPCDEFKTIKVSVNSDAIESVELYIQSKGERVSGSIEIKNIVLTESEVNEE